MKKTFALISVGVAAALLGCGADKNLKQSAAEPTLMQTWEGACASSDLLDLSLRTYFEFSGAGYKEVHTFYSEKDCRGEAAEVRYTGALTLREQAPNGLRNVDFRFDKVDMTVLGPKGKEILEKVKFCGIESWAMGPAIDLTGKTGTAGCPLRKVPTGEFNVTAVENNVLFLGKSGLRGGADVEKDRPTEVERDKPYHVSARKL